jgi:hypothetical protein
VKIQQVRNEASKIDGVCMGECLVGDCSWYLKASQDNRKDGSEEILWTTHV